MTNRTSRTLAGVLYIVACFWPLTFSEALAQSVSDVGGSPALILNATAQDREVFLTWSTLPEARYAIRWRQNGELQWNIGAESDRRYAAVDSLENGLSYEFQLVVNVGGRRFLSPPVIASPRVRDDCDYGASVFCTQQAFTTALPRYGILPSGLQCNGELVSIEDVIPNCRFNGGGVILGLDRAYGSEFVPNDFRPSADVVSRVLTRAIWGTEDFEAVKRKYSRRWAQVLTPFGGKVDTAGRVKSYVVRIAPALYSRISWYSRPDHLPGRYAIYHEGHGEAGISSAANVIDWLLRNGWQVLALDMPLEGVNEVDSQYPFYDHDNFATYEGDEAAGLRLFFIPIVSAMEMIESDSASFGNPRVMILGRSGGAWSAYTYAAMDRRIEVAVNISGGAPFSTLLDSTAFANRITPHFENEVDYLYDQVSLTDIMLAGGRRGAFFFYSENDPCCYRFSADNGWIRYIQRLGESPGGKVYRVFLDDARQHGLTDSGLAALGRFLSEVGLRPGRTRPISEATATPDRD